MTNTPKSNRGQPTPETSNTAKSPSPFTDAEVIYAYTRAQAIADGVLVDVSTTAREAGFRVPVAVTHAVFARYVEVPEGVEGQDAKGRLWDILWMLRSRAVRKNDDGSELLYQLHVMNDNRSAELVTLKSVCGPGDDGEPVITVMLPEED